MLNKPKFRYALFLTEQQKKVFNQDASKPVICSADSYSVGEDGAITFYHSTNTNDKLFKIPVLTYPSGKWEACLLIDNNNFYPVFNTQAVGFVAPSYNQQSKPANVQQNIEETTNATDLNDYISNNNQQSPQQQNNNYNNSNPNFSVPGTSQNNNPEEFKKAKNEFLEQNIKDFLKTNDTFIVSEFISYISKNPDSRKYKPNDIDVSWAAANLIKEKLVLSRKFSNTIIQKTLSLILPDIMRRQYEGKMSPILTILLDKEETKNVTAIDLAVWMSQNGFS